MSHILEGKSEKESYNDEAHSGHLDILPPKAYSKKS